MFQTSQGPSSGSHNLFLTEVTGFCVRRQCLAAYPDPWCVCTALTDTIDTHTKGQDMQPNTDGAHRNCNFG
jgi:hypothetical protein